MARDEIDANKARADNGVTSLHIVCCLDHTEIAAMLLARDEIDVNKEAHDGRTPLHIAAMHGHFLTAQLLAVYGAGVTAVDIDGDTAIDVAAEGGHLTQLLLLSRT